MENILGFNVHPVITFERQIFFSAQQAFKRLRVIWVEVQHVVLVIIPADAENLNHYTETTKNPLSCDNKRQNQNGSGRDRTLLKACETCTFTVFLLIVLIESPTLRFAKTWIKIAPSLSGDRNGIIAFPLGHNWTFDSRFATFFKDISVQVYSRRRKITFIPDCIVYERFSLTLHSFGYNSIRPPVWVQSLTCPSDIICHLHLKNRLNNKGLKVAGNRICAAYRPLQLWMTLVYLQVSQCSHWRKENTVPQSHLDNYAWNNNVKSAKAPWNLDRLFTLSGLIEVRLEVESL